MISAAQKRQIHTSERNWEQPSFPVFRVRYSLSFHGTTSNEEIEQSSSLAQSHYCFHK